MGGRGAASSGDPRNRVKLQKIEYNEEWLYQPDENTDLSDLAKNPIPYVGVGRDTKLGYEIEDDTIQTKYESNVLFPIEKLETLQPFVLRSGIENYKRFDGTERPYVVEYEGHYYLLDGNHRAAIAKLRRQKEIAVDLSHRRHK